MATCLRTYASTWPKLAVQASSTCGGPRFVDHGNGTMTDALTGLQWELKTDDGSLHDQDNVYSWSAGIHEATGTVFTAFLTTLNGSCFAGHCDWRLPTRAELQTLMVPSYPCTTPPCVDLGVVGPTASAFYWSSSTNPTGDGFVWGVQFASGVFGAYPKSLEAAARAVRSVR
ncbi:MAG: DUF1566 domain-containing protein [Deltaproteobacteria bacterium]|nr:DUF1566 domain-containing protein [Deltaproteobacteria bacterium]